MTASYTYWQDPKDGMFLGYMNEYPEYMTQGHTLEELRLMLLDIVGAIRDGDLVDTAASKRQQGILEIA